MKVYPLLLLCPICMAMTAVGQSLQVSLNVNARPDPVIANWGNHPEYARVTIINVGKESVSAKLGARVFRNGMLQAETQNAMMPVITIPPGISVYQADQIIPHENVKFYGDAVNTVMRTGMLPAGVYQFCVMLVDANSSRPIGQQPCSNFQITSYQSPFLLQPANNARIAIPSQTIFRWSPVMPQPPGQVHYHLRIMPLLPLQTMTQAVQTNPPLVDREIINQTQTIWPAEFVPGIAESLFVWTVQARDDEGHPLGEPDGTAAPFIFCCGCGTTTDSLPKTGERPKVDSTKIVGTTPVDSTPTYPTPTTSNCKCTIDHEWLGGPPITIV